MSDNSMSVEKAINLLEEFKVIDDWSAVYMPDLHDAIDVVINHITETSADIQKVSANDTPFSDISILRLVARIFIEHIRPDGDLYTFDPYEQDILDKFSELLKNDISDKEILDSLKMNSDR